MIDPKYHKPDEKEMEKYCIPENDNCPFIERYAGLEGCGCD